jgi:hypothetical protein
MAREEDDSVENMLLLLLVFCGNFGSSATRFGQSKGEFEWA